MFRRAKELKVVLDVRIDANPCLVDATAARKCLAECGATARGDMRAECIGGELVGTCQGRCASKCTFPAGPGGGECHAVCSGRCDSDFRGVCGGNCVGTCDGAPLKGSARCSGICDGSCNDHAEGFCGGRCDGQCSDTWVRAVPTGNCRAVCMGGCAGEVADPLCTGEYAPTGMDSACQAACNGTTALAARCDLPVVHVVVRGGTPDFPLVKLLFGVQSAVPKILRQQAAAKRLTRALQTTMSASAEWSDTFAIVGPKPLSCIRAFSDTMKSALAAVELCSVGSDAVAGAIKTDPVLVSKPGE
jgi:hypothetical protein